MNEIKSLINKELKLTEEIIKYIFETQSTIYLTKNYNLNDIINILQVKINNLLKIDEYCLIKIQEFEFDYITKNIIENHKLEEDIHNELLSVNKNSLFYLDKNNYTNIYKFINKKYVFGFFINELFYNNNKENYIILLSTDDHNKYLLYKFYSLNICNKLSTLISKVTEFFLISELKTNLKYIKNFENIFDDILIELIDTYDLLSTFVLYNSLKVTMNNLEYSEEINLNNDNPTLILNSNTIFLKSNENFVELNFFLQQKKIEINIIKTNYLNLKKDFKLWKNVDNHSIMFFNSKNEILFYNFINRNWFNIEEFLKNSANNVNNQDNKINSPINLEEICRNHFFYEKILSILKSMIDYKVDIFEIIDPTAVFQLYYNNDELLGYSIMIKNILNWNFNNDNFWKKFSFVIEKNLKIQDKKQIGKSFIKNKSLLIEKNLYPNKLNISDKNIPINNSRKFYESINHVSQKSNYSKTSKDITSLHDINFKTKDNIDKSILMEFIPEKAKIKKKVISNFGNHNEQRKSIFITNFNDKNLKKNFEKKFENRKAKFEDLMLNDMDKNLLVKQNEIKDFENFLDNKPEIESIDSIDDFEEFDSWDFNTLDMGDKDLCKIIFTIFGNNDWFNCFKLDKNIILEFLWKCNFYYSRNNNQFHNFKHGITVAHSLNYLFKFKFIDKLLDKEQKFALLISAIGHDLDHRGKTNSFEINSNSNLALKYNDKSPLEQHHCYILFKILSIDSTNLLKKFNLEVYRNLREIMIVSILYTDMKTHFDLLSEIKSKLENGELNENKEDFLKLCGFTLHLADLGGPGKKFDISLSWSKLLNQEFINQYNEEEKLKISLTPHFKDLNDLSIYHNNEYKFMKFLIVPLYETFYILIDKDSSFGSILNNTTENMKCHYDLYLLRENEETELNVNNNEEEFLK